MTAVEQVIVLEAFAFLHPLYELWQDEKVREKVEETGRLFFSNSFLTIDLLRYIYWGAAILAGLALLLWLLSGDTFIGGDSYGSSGSGSGYGKAQFRYTQSILNRGFRGRCHACMHSCTS